MVGDIGCLTNRRRFREIEKKKLKDLDVPRQKVISLSDLSFMAHFKTQ